MEPKPFGRYLVFPSGRIVHRDSGLDAHETRLNGYRAVRHNKKYVYSHRIIASLFIENPDSLPFVNHRDGTRTNNSSDNLEWCSPKGNWDHAHSIGRFLETERRLKHANQRRIKVTPEIAVLAKSMYKTGQYSYADLARHFGCSINAIYRKIR